MTANPFRDLPPVSALLESDALCALATSFGHDVVAGAVRLELHTLRERLKIGQVRDGELSATAIAERVRQNVEISAAPTLRRVINATGIVLHTNLGRAPLAEAAAHAAAEAARGYVNVELDLATGKRSSRQDALRQVLRRLLGCESATAVNNCAGATVLVLRALAAGREVIVSRGQLVEIGGSFRIPEIMAVSGAKLVEVGTTNITRIGDYERAINAQTALLLRVHHSNFRVSGFTHAATLEELVALGRQRQIPVVDDVGSGALLDFAQFGLPGDPVVGESLHTGADLVLFSGDKLLGGPQAGVIVGKKDLVHRIEKDPLMRALRLDKMTLAALETTLRLYMNRAQVTERVPILRMLKQSVADLRPRAEALAGKLAKIPGLDRVAVEETATFVGGGSLPDLPLASVVVAMSIDDQSIDDFAANLRRGTPAVVARVHDNRVLVDLRTVFPEQDQQLFEALSAAATVRS